MVERVLIVDDDRLLGESLEKLLTHRGVEAEYAEDPHNTLFVLKQKAFDLVLIDLNMPSVNGIDLAELVMKTYPQINTIIMTGGGSVEDYARAQSIGISDFLHKPFEFDMFFKMVKGIGSAGPEPDVSPFKSMGRYY